MTSISAALTGLRTGAGSTLLFALAACAQPPGAESTEASAASLALPTPAAARELGLSRPVAVPDPDLAFVLAGAPPGAGDPVPADVRAAFARSRFGGIPDLTLASSASRNGSTWRTLPQMRVSATAIPTQPGWYSLTLTGTGTGWVERMVVRIPNDPSPHATPVLVVLHKFGATEWDFYYHTSFLAEADARDWLLVAPYSASTKHFGSDAALRNTELALQLVFQLFPQADPRRVYGVGFSMGGAALLEYAARHLDPLAPRFAALVSHTGGGALRHTYENEYDDDDADDDLASGSNLEVPDILDFWFGGPPTRLPFAYQSHSVLDLSGSGAVGQGTNLLANLVHLPVRFFRVQDDPLLYLREQHLAVYEQLSAQGGAAELVTVPGSVHSWSTLDESATCDWLAQHVLPADPPSGTLLAPEDGRFLAFELARERSSEFGGLQWSVQSATNSLELLDTRNLARIALDVTEAGLAATTTLRLTCASADASADHIELRGLTVQPHLVLRNGSPFGSWSYDPQAGTLSFDDDDPASTLWVVEI